MTETPSLSAPRARIGHALPGRRAVLAGGAALLIAGAGSAPAAALAALERRRGGRLGVFALDLQNGQTLGHRTDERFKLMSSFKGLLTAAVLHDVASGREHLDAPVRYGAGDLLDASPVTQANLARGAMSVGDLCAATMIRSDNAAANLLMRRIGGPARVTAFVRALGDPVTRIDNYEGHLTDHPLPADSTTPRAIVGAVRVILFGPTLPAGARAQWRAWMMGNVVGRTRLRAAFPADWSAGDRTGTGDGICNDYAFADRPGRAPLLLSVYHAAPGLELPAQEAVLREASRIIVEWQAHTEQAQARRVAWRSASRADDLAR